MKATNKAADRLERSEVRLRPIANRRCKDADGSSIAAPSARSYTEVFRGVLEKEMEEGPCLLSRPHGSFWPALQSTVF